MKKIISIILIGMMTIGCGKTSRLTSIEREAQIAAEARLADIAEQTRLEAVRLANRSSWEKFKDGFWKHSVGYSMLIFTAVAAGTYHFCYRKPKPLEKKQENEHPKKQPNFATDTVQTGLPVDVPKVVENTQTQTEIIPEKITDFVNQAPINNQQQTLTQINKPVSPYSLIGMPNFNKPKPMLALTYDPKPTDIVVSEQLVNFLNKQPVNHPWQPNNSVFSEPFIQYYEKTFKQKPIPMLTYDPKLETQVESLQDVNENPLASVEENVENNSQAPIPDPQQLTINHQDEPIKAVEAPVRNARDPSLLDEALFTLYGDGRHQGSLYDIAVNDAVGLYAWGWQNADRPENRRVPWLRYTQAIWEVAIERWDQRRLHGKPLPPRPVYPWLPIEEKTRQEKAAEERLANAGERWYIDDAVSRYAWGWENENAPMRVNWKLHTPTIWKKAIAKWDQERDQKRPYPPRPVPPWE